MQGHRVPYKPGFPRGFLPGDYCLVPKHMDLRGAHTRVWYAMAPNGDIGALLESIHKVTEHEDFSISVSPSIVMPSGWHGFLRNGVWSA